ncbi:hypothetical protein SYNPS1DRAFT_26596 [Syncephalis pseudoplumigaleata]|uniref:DASH complex subunit ASK1 n=1 Tax=Syncephalis pseudoplumigaleata TaxID=1712513 RepID=A0A4P9Z5I1_9FUNG|nr:hypothetical protein SYNPS1DRAFT_26596 [Syncephalis pseudoplumigaleata]|eukprot:RKP27775.1 hypothetical protein SYNPS1DRAFT_26596 [Syncephalis pseudoplumigaleata]
MSQPHAADLAAHLELVEQNITLTLQQIDHNFAACYNTVATKLLPRIDRFGDVSNKIWEGSQAWLRFFESLESSQKASIPLPPSPTETTNTPDRSAREELSTRLEYSRALSHRTDATQSTPTGAADAMDEDKPSITHTPANYDHSLSMDDEHADEHGHEASAADLAGRARPQPAQYPPSQMSHSTGITSMDPPSLHFRTLHMNNSTLRATPIKARAPNMASTPRLLRQVLTATASIQQRKRQTMTPRRDPHTLFDVATPCSDATTTDDDEDDDDDDGGMGTAYPRKKAKANESEEVDNSTDRYLEMNSPPVTLQFTLPIAKTPGRTAVDAIIEEISPASNSPSNTEFLTRIQETATLNKGGRGAAAAGQSHDNLFESSVGMGGSLFGRVNAQHGGNSSSNQSKPSDSVSDLPSFVRRQQQQALKEKSASDVQQGHAGSSIAPGQSLEQFVTDIDDIDALLAMPGTPVVESARKQLQRIDQMPDRPPNPLFVEPARNDVKQEQQHVAKDDDSMSIEEQSHAMGDPAKHPNHRSGRWSPELSSTPMPLRRPQPPQFAQHKDTPFGVSLINEQSQLSNIPSSAMVPAKTATMEVASRAQPAVGSSQASSLSSSGMEAVPAFELSLFPTAFQKPPGSVQLQQLYAAFRDNAGKLLVGRPFITYAYIIN